MREIDIKCPGCGKVFQVVEKVYKENQDIVCPRCATPKNIFKPKGHELTKG